MRSADGRARARQKARAHAIGDLAEPQVEARRLDLVVDEFVFRQDRALAHQRRDHAVGQDAFLVDCKGERHDAAFPILVLSGSDSR